jgi:pseudaminic acid synthase
MSYKSFNIKGRLISEKTPPFIVAELSANHNGSIDKAKEIILLAHQNGADAIKLQTYTPDTLTINSSKEDFMLREGLWSGNSLYSLYESAYTPFEWHEELFSYAEDVGIICFSSPFDESAVDLLESLNTPAYKIASFELVDIPLIRYVASKKKPMILSTGMANEKDINNALEAVRKEGNQEVLLLHCVSSYPAPPEQYNLKTIPLMREKFNCMVGLSDHTIGNYNAIASVALGAVFIEKHFISSRKEVGPDSTFSMEPDELLDLTKSTKEVWESLGEDGLEIQESEKANIKFRRSIYVIKDIKKGDTFNHENIRRIRPGYGMSPIKFESVLGKRANSNIEAGTPLQESFIK